MKRRPTPVEQLCLEDPYGERPVDWPARHTEFWTQNPRPPVSYAKALAGLVRHIEAMKEARALHEGEPPAP